MNFLPESLLKLQRLARAIKKHLKQPATISTKSDINDFLRIASIESDDQNIVVLYNDFASTISEQDEAELSADTVESIKQSSNYHFDINVVNIISDAAKSQDDADDNVIAFAGSESELASTG